MLCQGFIEEAMRGRREDAKTGWCEDEQMRKVVAFNNIMHRFHCGAGIISVSENFCNSGSIPIPIPTAPPIEKVRVSSEISHFGSGRSLSEL